MAKHTHPATLARAIEKRIRDGQMNIAAAHRMAANETFEDARKLVSGGTKTKQLRKENHPFGKGFTAPNGRRRRTRKPLPINVQSNALRSAIKLETKSSGPGGYVYSINFRGGPHYAGYVLSPTGTVKMRARGYWREVRKLYRSRMLGVKLAFRK